MTPLNTLAFLEYGSRNHCPCCRAWVKHCKELREYIKEAEPMGNLAIFRALSEARDRLHEVLEMLTLEELEDVQRQVLQLHDRLAPRLKQLKYPNGPYHD